MNFESFQLEIRVGRRIGLIFGTGDDFAGQGDFALLGVDFGIQKAFLGDDQSSLGTILRRRLLAR